jgi:hypothetical protein
MLKTIHNKHYTYYIYIHTHTHTHTHTHMHTSVIDIIIYFFRELSYNRTKSTNIYSYIDKNVNTKC